MNITIFTDGSSRGNPGNGGWGAVCVYPNAHGEMRVDELGGAQASVTNNQMELRAAIEALKNFENYYSAEDAFLNTYGIYTDSSYLINGITKWVNGWESNGWITKTKDPVLNKEMWQELLAVTKDKDVDWKYIGGHRGVIGNERCDEIATAFADALVGKAGQPNLYKGSLADYGKDILNFDVNESVDEKRSASKSRSRSIAYSYISMIEGNIMTHQTWKECEDRVKGKKGAKYKKSISAEDEKNIIADFKSFASRS